MVRRWQAQGGDPLPWYVRRIETTLTSTPAGDERVCRNLRRPLSFSSSVWLFLTSVNFGTMAGWYSLSFTRLRSEFNRFLAMPVSSSSHSLLSLPFAWTYSSRHDDPTLHTANWPNHQRGNRGEGSERLEVRGGFARRTASRRLMSCTLNRSRRRSSGSGATRPSWGVAATRTVLGAGYNRIPALLSGQKKKIGLIKGQTLHTNRPSVDNHP